MPLVWSPANSHLTGAGTTAITQAGTNAVNYSALGSQSVTTGKYYFEATLDNFTDSGESIGLANTSSSIADGVWPGSTSDTLGFYGHGTTAVSIYNAGASIGYEFSLTLANTDRFAIAFDRDAGLVWFEDVTTASGWFGSATSATGDPAAGANGLVIPSGVLAQPVVPMGSGFLTGSVITIYATAGSWLGSAPAGFAALPSGDAGISGITNDLIILAGGPPP